MKDDHYDINSYGFVIRLAAMFLLPVLLSIPLKSLGSAPREITSLIPIGILLAIVILPRFLRQEATVIAFSAGLTAYFVAPSEIAQIKFYELIAQIAPVLFLTLAIETRSFSLSPIGGSKEIAKLMIAAVLAYAEFESLRVIVIDSPRSGNFNAVAAALIAAAVLLILGSLVGLQPGAHDSS